MPDDSDRVTCPACGKTDDIDAFDCLGACLPSNIFCTTCHCEFDSVTGREHVLCSDACRGIDLGLGHRIVAAEAETKWSEA